MSSTNHRKKMKMIESHSHCYWCKKKLIAKTATIDHLLPKSKGGDNAPGNLVLACWRCNNKRKDRIAPGFFPKFGSWAYDDGILPKFMAYDPGANR